MEKRSRRRIRDLVALSASQGLSQNEIGCARISMMARSTNASFTGRIQKRKTYPLHYSHPACNTRPVHTDVPEGDIAPQKPAVFYLTTIGVFSVDAMGAIDNTSQVFQPDDRF